MMLLARIELALNRIGDVANQREADKREMRDALLEVRQQVAVLQNPNAVLLSHVINTLPGGRNMDQILVVRAAVDTQDQFLMNDLSPDGTKVEGLVWFASLWSPCPTDKTFILSQSRTKLHD